jgi:hypothetical protein
LEYKGGKEMGKAEPPSAGIVGVSAAGDIAINHLFRIYNHLIK